MDTPLNKPVAKQLWNKRPSDDHFVGIMTFNDRSSASPEELLLSRLDSIDLHHGAYSADPPYTILEVIGTPPTEKIKVALSELGLNEFRTFSNGFMASRPNP